MSQVRILCLGAGDGWHANQLLEAAAARGSQLSMASYESLAARVTHRGTQLDCAAGDLGGFDAILTRTMPAGSLEQITFRLAVLHTLCDIQRLAQPGKPTSGATGVSIVNPPRSLEIAIDKFATLARVQQLGYEIPDTIAVQSRSEAMDAFAALGRDCVVKPVFGGEGRGVMRIADAELAWYAFSTLQNLQGLFYLQRFVPPGGCDTRLLVIGDQVIGLRRRNDRDFRTNVASGGSCEAMQPTDGEVAMARRICQSIGLSLAAVDLLDSDDGRPKVIEVNAIPGWKGAQSVTRFSIAQRIIGLLETRVATRVEACH